MKKIFCRICLCFVVMAISGVCFTPQAFADEYYLFSSDKEVQVAFDSKFGGAITGIWDYANMGNLNLIDGYQAGAMFQTAFWILPYHNYNPPYGSADSRFPPDCFNRGWRGDDMTLDNPTQAGFVADGRLGNPIGYFGTSSDPDRNEFMRYEDNTVHFKTRFIRYDFCQNDGATMDKRQWWDTDFYIEQWASFRSDFPRTLTLKSKITYTGSNPRMVTTRQMPVIFACHLPNTTYWKNGQKISTQDGGGIDPDQNWAALTAANKEVGIGMITSPGMTAMLGRSKIGREAPRIYSECNNDFISTLYPGSGVPDLRTMGVITNVDYDTASNHVFTFNPGGSFEWTMYYPIGPISLIKTAADTLLSGLPEIHGSVDRVTCDNPNSAGWATDNRDHAQKLTIQLEVFPDGEPNNKIIRTGPANGIRPDLLSVCSPDGACAFGITLGTLPASFTNKKLRMNTYGLAPDGWKNQIGTTSDPFGPCTNLNPSPKPGDLDGDGDVDSSDFTKIVAEFGHPYTIFDYNILVGNFGK